MDAFVEMAKALANTPLPTVAFIFGTIFVWVAIMGGLPRTRIRPSRIQRVSLGIIGTLFLIISIGIFIISQTPQIADIQGDPRIKIQCTLQGKPTNAVKSFMVDQSYRPTQYMGDISDIETVGAGSTTNSVIFKYTTNGEGPHEFEWKYVDGKLNANPAQFAGIMFIDSVGAGGTDTNNGYDLRGYKFIKWEARSIQSNVKVKFVIGGVTWVWDHETGEKIPAPCPDSLKSAVNIQGAGVTLNKSWQEFQFDLTSLNPESLQHVVGAFGWVITWGDNGVNLITSADNIVIPENPKTFEIEIRNIRYEK